MANPRHGRSRRRLAIRHHNPAGDRTSFAILREHRVQILTVGQYLRPTEKHLPVVRYWHPDEFRALEAAAYELGFESVAAGPLVRSSYHADESAREVAERSAA